MCFMSPCHSQAVARGGGGGGGGVSKPPLTCSVNQVPLEHGHAHHQRVGRGCSCSGRQSHLVVTETTGSELQCLPPGPSQKRSLTPAVECWAAVSKRERALLCVAASSITAAPHSVRTGTRPRREKPPGSGRCCPRARASAGGKPAGDPRAGQLL